MGKLILWVVVILALLIVARVLARQQGKPSHPRANARATRNAASASQQPESMVRCAHCGIHLPRSEAVLLRGQTWCSTDHAKLGPPK